METRDRFELEQQLLQCWHITDDINTVINYIAQQPDIPATNQDELLNMLGGLRSLYHYRFRDMMNLFNELISKGDIVTHDIIDP
jgi:hypothetical protein